MLVSDLFAAYLRHSVATGLHTPEACRDRQRVFDLFLAWLDLPPERLAPAAVSEASRGQGLVQILPVAATTDRLRPYHLRDFIDQHAEWKSPSTRYSKAAFIKAAFAWAAQEERIDRDPFANVRYRQAEPRGAMPDAIFELICNDVSKPVERILRFLRYTGRRLSEAANARWQDMDLERGVWTIHRHKTRAKTGRDQLVALVPEAVALLRSMAKTLAVGEVAIGVISPGAVVAEAGGFVFLNSRKKPWTRSQLGKRVREARQRLGIKENYGCHSLRHRWATAALDAGAPIKMVAEQLGHTSTKTTERAYFHRSEATVIGQRSAAVLAMPK
jgi:integrase